jgi:hypothetical protein
MRRIAIGLIISISAALTTLPQRADAQDFVMCSLPRHSPAEFVRSLRLTINSLLPHVSPAPELLLKELPEPNAFALRGTNTIVLSAALYEQINSSAEEAFVVAHELGHLRQTSPTGANDAEQERDADLFAIQHLIRLNLDPHASGSLLQRLQRTSVVAPQSLSVRSAMQDTFPAKPPKS